MKKKREKCYCGRPMYKDDLCEKCYRAYSLMDQAVESYFNNLADSGYLSVDKAWEHHLDRLGRC